MIRRMWIATIGLVLLPAVLPAQTAPAKKIATCALQP